MYSALFWGESAWSETMLNWWKITKLELILAVRDKEAVIWSLIAPIAFAYVFGFMVRDAPAQPTRASIDRRDNPEYVETIFRGLLAKKNIEISDLDKYPRIVLPDRLLHRIFEGQAVGVDVLKREASDTRARAVSVKVREVLYTLTFKAKREWLSQPPDSSAIAALVGSEGPLLLKSEVLGREPRTAQGTEHTLPAMLVMFLLFQLVTFFMVLWVEDIKTGKIKRILFSPTATTGIFFAQVLYRIIWAVLQVVVVGGIGSIVLGVRLEVPFLYLAILLFVYMLAAVSLGMLLASCFTTAEKANAVGVIVTLVLSALGGCWWPLEIVQNDVMKTVAMFLPTGLMMNALGGLVALGKEAPFPTVNFMGLLLMSLVMMPAGIRRLKKQLVG